MCIRKKECIWFLLMCMCYTLTTHSVSNLISIPHKFIVLKKGHRLGNLLVNYSRNTKLTLISTFANSYSKLFWGLLYGRAAAIVKITLWGRGLLRQWKHFARHCHGGYMSFCICSEPQNVHWGWIRMQTVDFEWSWCISAGSPAVINVVLWWRTLTMREATLLR